MPFPPKLLNDEEELVLDLQPHWWFFAGPVASVAGLAALTIAVKAWDFPDPVVLVLVIALVGSVLWLGGRYARWYTTNFVLTTDRLIYRTGVIAKQGIEIPLDRVNTIFFNQSLFERLLGAGDLVIESAGEQGQQHFTDIRRPSLVQNMIYRQIEDNENRKFDRIGRRGGAASAPAPAESIPEQIEKLDELRRRGVITEAEFQAKKTDLLDRM